MLIANRAIQLSKRGSGKWYADIPSILKHQFTTDGKRALRCVGFEYGFYVMPHPSTAEYKLMIAG